MRSTRRSTPSYPPDTNIRTSPCSTACLTIEMVSVISISVRMAVSFDPFSALAVWTVKINVNTATGIASFLSSMAIASFQVLKDQPSLSHMIASRRAGGWMLRVASICAFSTPRRLGHGQLGAAPGTIAATCRRPSLSGGCSLAFYSRKGESSSKYGKVRAI